MTTPSKSQVGGDHYTSKPIQPWDYIEATGMDFFEGNALKYLSRWKDKDGVEDLYKAIHYIQKVIERHDQGCYGLNGKKHAVGPKITVTVPTDPHGAFGDHTPPHLR